MKFYPQGMQLAELIQLRVPSKAKSKRASIIELFITELNSESFRVYSKRGVAMKLSHVKTEDLMDFYLKCLRYKKEKGSFGKIWWGSLKLK